MLAGRREPAKNAPEDCCQVLTYCPLLTWLPTSSESAGESSWLLLRWGLKGYNVITASTLPSDSQSHPDSRGGDYRRQRSEIWGLLRNLPNTDTRRAFTVNSVLTNFVTYVLRVSCSSKSGLLTHRLGFRGGSVVKNLSAKQETRKIPWRREWQPAPVSLPGASHGQRSLAGYGPWCPQSVGHDLATPWQWWALLHCWE